MVETAPTQVEIKMLGRFEVRLDGEPVPPSEWTRPQAATLVKVLALAPGRRLHREQLIDRLWPDLPAAEAAPRLHKLAHYARRALGGDGSAAVLREEMVALLPDTDVTIDADVFERAADEAIANGTPAAAVRAADLYGGTLLPDDPYEEWADQRREQLRMRYRELLRTAARWDDLLEDDPAAEDAHLAVMNRHVAAGDHRAALRQFERMDAALRREFGVGPGPQALSVRDEALAMSPDLAPATDEPQLVGRRAEREQLERLLADTGHGRGRTVLVSGPPGVGKSAMLEWLRGRAEQEGWRVGKGMSAAIEGAWPYAPVLDALADLYRRHPTLLDGLDDTYRQEIERALVGSELAWSGEGTHQRLFVAAAELVRLAASSTGLLLTIDDVHEADEASLRLLHYLGRCVNTESALIAVGYREGAQKVEQVKSSLLRRNAAFEVVLSPLDRAGTDELVRAHLPDASEESLQRIWEVSDGLPFAVVEMARSPADGPVPDLGMLGLRRLAVRTRDALQRVAVIGTSFDTDQFVALTGLPEADAFGALDTALATRVVVHTGTGYRFRHDLIREALLADVPPAQQRTFHREASERLAAVGAPPARIANHLIKAGELSAAVPHVLQAVEAEAAIGAYRDALELVDAVLDHAEPDDHARLLALRAHLLAALGERAAVDAYRQALAAAPEQERPQLLARMAQAAIMEGDVETAATIVDGLEPDGGPADAAILLVKGNLAYYRGDLDAAWTAAQRASDIVPTEENSWQRMDVLTLQALIAHDRGETFSRLRAELLRAQDTPALASSLMFDPYLCVVECLLYGTTPYREVRSLAESLRETARRSGVLRGEAFATAMLGEAAVLAGEVDVAERELQDAIDLHRELAAPVGEANSLQRLAELRLHQQDRAAAERLLRQALPRARWSLLAPHLLQRIYATLIRAAPDPSIARLIVDDARDAIANEDRCHFCDIMLVVPAAIACADVGDIAEARRYLAAGERLSTLWKGTSWQAALLEARAHLAQAEGEVGKGMELLHQAGQMFEQAGQPLDAERCRKASASPSG